MLQGMDTEIQLSNEPPTRSSPSQRRVTSIALTDELIARLDRYANQAAAGLLYACSRVGLIARSRPMTNGIDTFTAWKRLARPLAMMVPADG
jgi:hypothetical protein